MRRSALALGIALAVSGAAHALELAQPRVDVMLHATSAKDPFRIRGTLAGVDLAAVVDGAVTVRFGPLRERVPPGQFRRRGRNVFTWRSYRLGVKKVTVNVKKGTIDVAGAGSELGDLGGPVTLAIGTIEGALCAQLSWAPPRPAKGGRASRLQAVMPFAPCANIASVAAVPQVLLTGPTDLPGIAIATPTVSLAGVASDDVAIVGLSWSNDRGGGGTITPGASWSIPDVPLQPGDNRITVTATDAGGNAGTDVIVVTYNENGIAFEASPIANPDHLFVDTQRGVTIRQGIVLNLDLDPASVTLVRLDAAGTPTAVESMSDDGELANGDQIPGDGYYSSLVSLSAVAGGQRFRVAARTLSQPDLVAYSPVVEVPTIEHVPPAALAAATALADDASAMLQRLSASPLSPADALAQVVSLSHAYGVSAVGLADGGRGAWWVTADGLLGGALGHDQTLQRGGVAAPPAVPRPQAPRAGGAGGFPGGPVQVGTRRTIILAPYFETEEPAALEAMLGAVGCPSFDVDLYDGVLADAERFKGLEDYGVIVVASHGDALFGGIGAAYRDEWRWSRVGSQGVLLTGTRLSALTLDRWEHDLRLGRMAVMAGGAAAVLPSFITRYTLRMPGTLVYAGACNSAANPTLASAFLGRGALAFLGYDGYVASSFARDTAVDLFTKLLAGQTVAEAHVPGATDGGSPPASLAIAGNANASLTTEVIVNASFEFASGFIASVSGFTVAGDGRVIGNLGAWMPTDGDRMALVSTGLGLTRAAGSFGQAVCLPPLPPGATTLTLSYDWNFFSEEFLEYCGSEFQDSFEVSFGATTLQSDQIDDLCGVVFPDPIAFDRGDVHTTGWQTQSVDVTPFAGTTNVLRFAATDVGDSVYDTVILVDRVRLTAE